MYFQTHYDGQYWAPDTRECSYFTLQAYLAGEEGDGVSLSRMLLYPYVDFITEPPMGGATRIFSKQLFDSGDSGAEEGQYLPLHSHTHNPTRCI